MCVGAGRNKTLGEGAPLGAGLDKPVIDATHGGTRDYVAFLVRGI